MKGRPHEKRKCLQKATRYVNQNQKVTRKELIQESAVSFNIGESSARNWIDSLIQSGRLEKIQTPEGEAELEVTEKGEEFIKELEV